MIASDVKEQQGYLRESGPFYVLDVLARFGVQVTYVDGTDLDQWQAAIRSDTKAVFFESMSNPTLEIVDIEGVAKLAHAAGALVVVDNVFTTPVYSRAIAQGADVVVYSATKHIDGSGRCLGGVICGTRQFVREVAEPYLKHTGGAISPFNAWLMLSGLGTMELRVNAQTENAGKLAAALAGDPKLTRVIYPGLASHPQHDLAMRQMGGVGGTMIAVDLGSKDAAFAAMNKMRIFQISNNLGDAKSIVTHPTTTTHQRLTEDVRAGLGITPGLLRLSIGIEHADDLIEDFRQAIA